LLKNRKKIKNPLKFNQKLNNPLKFDQKQQKSIENSYYQFVIGFTGLKELLRSRLEHDPSFKPPPGRLDMFFGAPGHDFSFAPSPSLELPGQSDTFFGAAGHDSSFAPSPSLEPAEHVTAEEEDDHLASFVPSFILEPPGHETAEDDHLASFLPSPSLEPAGHETAEDEKSIKKESKSKSNKIHSKPSFVPSPSLEPPGHETAEDDHPAFVVSPPGHHASASDAEAREAQAGEAADASNADAPPPQQQQQQQKQKPKPKSKSKSKPCQTCGKKFKPSTTTPNVCEDCVALEEFHDIALEELQNTQQQKQPPKQLKKSKLLNQDPYDLGCEGYDKSVYEYYDIAPNSTQERKPDNKQQKSGERKEAGQRAPSNEQATLAEACQNCFDEKAMRDELKGPVEVYNILQQEKNSKKKPKTQKIVNVTRKG